VVGDLVTRQANFGLTQLANDLLQGVTFTGHPDLLSNSPGLTFDLAQVSGAGQMPGSPYLNKYGDNAICHLKAFYRHVETHLK